MSVVVEHDAPGTLLRIADCTSGVRLQMSTTVDCRPTTSGSSSGGGTSVVTVTASDCGPSPPALRALTA